VLLAVSVQDLRPNPQDTSAFYLANMYQIFADPNFTLPRTSIPSTVAIPTPFSPPTYAVWVNSLWFLSLVISLSCALLAMSLRQWARRFIRLTRREGYTPEERARTRAFFSRGIENMHVPWAVEALPAMLHLSFFLFFSGLLIFLFNINHSAFISVASCIGVFSFLYGWITFLPIFWPNSPYYGPLSPAAWLLYAALRSALFLLHTTLRLALRQPQAALRSARLQLQAALRSARLQLQAALQSALLQLRAALQSPLIRVVFFIIYGSPKEPQNPSRSLAWRYGYRMSTGLWKVADEVVARDGSCKTDVDILGWTMKNALGEDNKLEKFFQAIPGLLQSKKSGISAKNLADLGVFWDALDSFLRRTLSSDSVIDSVKSFRLDTYFKIIGIFEHKPKFISEVLRFILRRFSGQLPQTIKRTNILARWCSSRNNHIALAARCVVASILQSSEERDRHWLTLARDRLGIPKRVLCDIIHRDEHSVSLAIFIQMTEQILQTETWIHDLLMSLSNFDARKASSGLRNEFCDLWNRIIRQAMTQGFDSDPVYVLRAIYPVYAALHNDVEDYSPHQIPPEPSWDLECKIPAHHQNRTDPRSTQHGDPETASPHPSCLETQLIPCGSTVPQQAEDVDLVLRPSLSIEYPLPQSQRPPSAPPTTDLVNNPLQIVSVTHPSVHESIQIVALDLIRLASMEVSHLLRQSQSSADATSVSVQQQLGNFPDTSSPITPALT
jgi:Family of unknown function (DUF6535)